MIYNMLSIFGVCVSIYALSNGENARAEFNNNNNSNN